MFSNGDAVLYGAEGVCRLEGSTQREIGGKKLEYYVLKPVYRAGSTVFVPKGNETLTAKMRRVLSPEEIHKLIQEIPEEKELWIENEGERRAEYGRIVSGGDRRELIRVIKALYQRRQKQQELGKKFHLSDERFLKEAEEKLHGEFALVLNIQPDQVTAFIRREIGAEEETDWGESAIS